MSEKRKFNPFNISLKEVPMSRKIAISSSIGIVLVLAFLAIFLGGWTTHGTQTVALAMTSRPAAVSASKSIVPSPNSPKFGCGTSFYYPQVGTNTGFKLLGSTNDGAQENVACFLQAFQKCVPASIGLTVDSGGAEASWLGEQVPSGANPTVKDYDFSTQPQSGGCAISKSVHLNMELQPKEAETCARVEQTGTDLSFVGCGNSGTITFPLDGPK